LLFCALHRGILYISSQWWTESQKLQYVPVQEYHYKKVRKSFSSYSVFFFVCLFCVCVCVCVCVTNILEVNKWALGKTNPHWLYKCILAERHWVRTCLSYPFCNLREKREEFDPYEGKQSQRKRYYCFTVEKKIEIESGKDLKWLQRCKEIYST